MLAGVDPTAVRVGVADGVEVRVLVMLGLAVAVRVGGNVQVGVAGLTLGDEAGEGVAEPVGLSAGVWLGVAV